MDNYIALGDCKHGQVYKINSRNLSFGVFKMGVYGFIGIREKFGSRYLFTEFHWDTGAPFGTVMPIKVICMLPSNIMVNETLVNIAGDLWAENPETGNLEAVERTDFSIWNPVTEKYEERSGIDKTPHGKRQGFEDKWVSTGKRLPDDRYPHCLENKALFEFLEKIENENKAERK
jgi:hypothetical protein